MIINLKYKDGISKIVPSQRVSQIYKSFIHEMARLAVDYKTINLSQGFPDFNPPREVIEAAHHALDSGANQYAPTWGLIELRQAITTKMKNLYNLDFDPHDHITVACGVTEAIVSALMSIVNPGDEVIIIEPYHEGYVPGVVLTGANPRFMPLEPPDYALDLDRLGKLFSSRTRAIIVNSPHNHSGRVFTRAELEGIAKLCEEFDVIVISDEIYEHIIYDNRTHIPFASLPGMRERTVTVSGFGKAYAMTGWRLGYACTINPLSTALRTVHDYLTICAPTPLQVACVAALKLPDSYYHQMRHDYTSRRTKMMSILQEADFIAHEPEGAYYVMADFSAWDFDGDDCDFARWLPKNIGVSVVPGSGF